MDALNTENLAKALFLTRNKAIRLVGKNPVLLDANDQLIPYPDEFAELLELHKEVFRLQAQLLLNRLLR
jgi:hypothetical protein